MTTHKSSLILTLAATLLFSDHAAAQDAAAKSAASLATVSRSVVRIEYELQYDKADAPEGAIGSEPCPGCGQVHGSELRKYLEDERPVEAAGFVVGAGRILTADPQMHPRFIKSITVRSGASSATATVSSHAAGQDAVFLELDKPLSGMEPIKFNAKAGAAAKLVTGNREGGEWVATQAEFPRVTSIAAGGAPNRIVPAHGLALSASGEPVGAAFASFLPADDSWHGSPLDWPQIKAADLKSHLAALEKIANAGLVRVTLSFRSPKGGENEMSQRHRYSGGMEEDGEDSTVRNVLGVLLPENRVLILTHLEPRVTARLETISVFSEDGTALPAKFAASLKRYGAFVATLEKPMAGIVKPSAAGLLALRGQLLLRADVELQGETRSGYFQSGRFATCKMGPRQQLYPELAGLADGIFLFTTQMELVALPVSHRGQVSGERSSYAGRMIEMVPAPLLAAAVAELPASADANNVPRTAEEENRLAWLGVELQPMNRDLARANNVAAETRDGETGALVTAVNPGSPAATAGIEVGSVLLRLKVPGQPLPVEVQLEEDGQRGQAFPWERLDEVPDQYFERIPMPWPATENSFTRSLTDLGFGTRYTAEFFAGGKLVAKEFEVVAGPADYNSAARFKSEPLGVTVRDLTYDVRRYLQRKGDEPGVVISKIETGSKVSIAGVKPYELITHINEQPVNNVKDFEKLSAAKGELKFSIKRMNRGRIATVKNGE